MTDQDLRFFFLLFAFFSTFFGACVGLMLLFIVIRRFDIQKDPGAENEGEED